jgi:histidyl-tRNA synthetase
MPIAPRIPAGVMELLPPQQIAFTRMLDTVRRGFERFGFLPVETPVFEMTDILLTKSGGETEKQVYFVQSTGAIKQGGAPEMALRFDLTVPLARYVAQREYQLNFPFRRYQIQRVYRGERNQKGRYREFYQCDIDVIGQDTLALAYDAELPAVIYGIFRELGFGAFTIYLNNRKLLRGLLDALGIVGTDAQASALGEVDRLGKMDRVEVLARLCGELSVEVASRLLDVMTAHAGDSLATLAALDAFTPRNPVFDEGLAELRRVYEGTLALGVPASALRLNLSIVRGLDYYTGTVYETFLDEHPTLGSICSGGRYENLAGHYTKSKLPGVGISIGATRLFSQLLEMGVIAADQSSVAQVLVLNLDPTLTGEYAAIATELRNAGINTEVYGGDDKLAKQFKYADRAKVPLAMLVGSRERDEGIVKIKNLLAAMGSEGQKIDNEIAVSRADIVSAVRTMLAPPGD